MVEIGDKSWKEHPRTRLFRIIFIIKHDIGWSLTSLFKSYYTSINEQYACPRQI